MGIDEIINSFLKEIEDKNNTENAIDTFKVRIKYLTEKKLTKTL